MSKTSLNQDKDQDNYVTRATSVVNGSMNHTSGVTGRIDQKTTPSKVDFSAFGKRDIESDQTQSECSDSDESKSTDDKNGSSSLSHPSDPQANRGPNRGRQRGRRPFNGQVNQWNNWTYRGYDVPRSYRGTGGRARASRWQYRRANYYRPRNNFRARGNWYQPMQHRYKPRLGQQYFWQDPGSCETRSSSNSLEMYDSQDDSDYSISPSRGKRANRARNRSWSRNRSRPRWNRGWRPSGRFRNSSFRRSSFRGSSYRRSPWQSPRNRQSSHFEVYDDQSQQQYNGVIPRGNLNQVTRQASRGEMLSIRNSRSASTVTHGNHGSSTVWRYPSNLNQKEIGDLVHNDKLQMKTCSPGPNSATSSVNTSLVSNSPSSNYSSYDSATAPVTATVTKATTVPPKEQSGPNKDQK